MDLFYKGYDPAAPITSGAQHLSAAAARFAVSIVRSIPHLPDAAWEEFQRLLSVNALWSLCVVLAGWVIATVVGGLIGLAVNALLIAYGLLELWEQIQEVGHALREWAVTAYEAQSDTELDAAAQHFATALTKGGITLLEILVTHRVFRAVEGKLRERFPPPDWLRKQYEQAASEREKSARPRETEPGSEKAAPPRERTSRPGEPKASAEKARRAAEKLADVTASGVRYEGAKGAAEDFPTLAVALSGALLVAGTVAVAAWASSTSARKVRP